MSTLLFGLVSLSHESRSCPAKSKDAAGCYPAELSLSSLSLPLGQLVSLRLENFWEDHGSRARHRIDGASLRVLPSPFPAPTPLWTDGMSSPESRIPSRGPLHPWRDESQPGTGPPRWRNEISLVPLHGICSGV